MVKAILTKPLDGHPEGTEREFDRGDFDALRRMGAVRAVDDLRSDGPTVGEFVAAGYRAETYPPQGYASRSTPDEITAAIASQAVPVPPASDGAEKAAPPVQNKAAPPVENKGDSGARPARKA